MENKVMGPAEAISRFVHDGDHISMGGFTVVRNPVGLVFEIVRRKIRNLHVYAHSQGQALDLLIGSGCVAAVEIAYGGTGRFSPSGGVCFRRAIEKGLIRFEDYSNYQMVLRFQAGAMGVPFLPLKGVVETDVRDAGETIGHAPGPVVQRVPDGIAVGATGRAVVTSTRPGRPRGLRR